MVGKKGAFDSSWFYGLFSIIIGAFFVLVFLSGTGALDTTGVWDKLFGQTTAFSVVQNVASSLTTGIFKLVAPSGADENTQYVALALFLLVWVVGTYSLANVGFFGSFSAFFVSGIVGMIGSRLLTKDIIDKSNFI